MKFGVGHVSSYSAQIGELFMFYISELKLMPYNFKQFYLENILFITIFSYKFGLLEDRSHTEERFTPWHCKNLLLMYDMHQIFLILDVCWKSFLFVQCLGNKYGGSARRCWCRARFECIVYERWKNCKYEFTSLMQSSVRVRSVMKPPSREII